MGICDIERFKKRILYLIHDYNEINKADAQNIADKK